MRRHHWVILGTIGAAFACLACLTPALVLGLGAMGVGTLTGRLDLVGLPLLVGVAGLAGYRYGRHGRRKR